MKTPPHLPAKSCSVPLHHRLEWFFQLGVMIVVAFVAAIAGTLVVIAWIVPVYTPNTVIYSIDGNNAAERDRVIDPLFLRQQEKQVVNIYDKRKKVSQEFYQDDAYVGAGVFLTSDGWLALYDTSYTPGMERFWEIVDYKGTVYVPEKAVVDPLTDLVYVKIVGDGFFASSFVSEDDAASLAFSWAVYERSWEPTLLQDAEKGDTRATFPIWTPRFARAIDTTANVGSILLAENGKLIGFVGANHHLISSFFLTLQYTTVFDRGAVEYRGVPWEGYMVKASVEDGVFKTIDGFYVTGAMTRRNATTVGIGDLIIRVQGKTVDEETLGKDMLSAPEEFTVTVLRDGEEFDILVHKEKLRI